MTARGALLPQGAGTFRTERATDEKIQGRADEFAANPEQTTGDAERMLTQTLHSRDFKRGIGCGQLIKRWRASGGIASRSSIVRKSIVLNCRSSAGGPQIFAPSARYARSSFGICTGSAA